MQTLSEATAIRLYYSVTTRDESGGITPVHPITMQQSSIESLTSYSCRICRWNRSDLELAKCPCQCKGSVGFIHFSCLRRWIMQRRNNHCEICNGFFDIPENNLDIQCMFKTFVCHCAGPIFKHILFSVSLLPLTHIIVQQVVICMENINLSSHQDITVKEVALVTTALMTSTAVCFNFFEFITKRIYMVRNILRHWWMFGNSSDFTLIPTGSEIFDLLN